jgi:hypothetical protein
MVTGPGQPFRLERIGTWRKFSQLRVKSSRVTLFPPFHRAHGCSLRRIDGAASGKNFALNCVLFAYEARRKPGCVKMGCSVSLKFDARWAANRLNSCHGIGRGDDRCQRTLPRGIIFFRGHCGCHHAIPYLRRDAKFTADRHDCRSCSRVRCRAVSRPLPIASPWRILRGHRIHLVGRPDQSVIGRPSA